MVSWLMVNKMLFYLHSCGQAKRLSAHALIQQRLHNKSPIFICVCINPIPITKYQRWYR